MKTIYKIGDIVEILEMCRANSRYIKAKIIEIYPKKGFNLYLCKNLQSNCKITFTDKDANEKIRKSKIVRGV